MQVFARKESDHFEETAGKKFHLPDLTAAFLIRSLRWRGLE